MMKCKYCGEEIANDSKFCESCGEKMANDYSQSRPLRMMEIDSPKKESVGLEMSDKKNSKSWLLWMLIVLVFVLASAIAANLFVHNQKQKEREVIQAAQEEKERQRLKDDYESAIRSFDFNVENIVVDREGREGAQNWVIGALKALQKIEQIESNPLFCKQENDTVFESRYYLFIARLLKVKMNLNDEYKNVLKTGESNPICEALRKRLRLIDEILSQTHEKSVVNVQLDLPEK